MKPDDRWELPVGTHVGFTAKLPIGRSHRWLSGRIVSTWQDSRLAGPEHQRYEIAVERAEDPADVGEWNVRPDDILFTLPGEGREQIEEWLES